MLLTPVVENCWQTYWRTGNNIRIIYENNKKAPTQIYINVMFEFIYLVSNIAVITADIFFEDWLSLAYYLGDSVYRLLVVKH